MADEDDFATSWIQNDVFKSLGIDDLGDLGLSSWDLGIGRPSAGGAIGLDQGDDFEDEVDDDIKREDVAAGPSGTSSKARAGSPKRLRFGPDGEIGAPRPRKKRKVAKPTEPPKPRDIKDIWPSFETGKVVNFTELLRYKVERKPRTHYHPPLSGVSMPRHLLKLMFSTQPLACLQRMTVQLPFHRRVDPNPPCPK